MVNLNCPLPKSIHKGVRTSKMIYLPDLQEEKIGKGVFGESGLISVCWEHPSPKNVRKGVRALKMIYLLYSLKQNSERREFLSMLIARLFAYT